MRILALLPLVAFAVLAGGCVTIHVDTVIDSTGGGTCTIALDMARDCADAVSQLAEANPDALGAGSMPAPDGLRRQQLEAACAAAGVELVRHEYTDDTTGLHAVVELAFRYPAHLSRALGALGDDDGGGRQELRLVAAGDGNYLLSMVSVPVTPSTDAADDVELDTDALAGSEDIMQHVAVLMNHLEELDIRQTVTVPGDVISSNAMEVEGRTSIWSINAANMMGAEDMDPEILFTGDGLDIPAGDER